MLGSRRRRDRRWQPAHRGPQGGAPSPRRTIDDLSLVVSNVPSTAIPSVPPTSREVLVVADPSPARAGPTALITAAVIGVIVDAMPTPMIVSAIAINGYGVSALARLIKIRPVPAVVSPNVSGQRGP